MPQRVLILNEPRHRVTVEQTESKHFPESVVSPGESSAASLTQVQREGTNQTRLCARSTFAL